MAHYENEKLKSKHTHGTQRALLHVCVMLKKHKAAISELSGEREGGLRMHFCHFRACTSGTMKIKFQQHLHLITKAPHRTPQQQYQHLAPRARITMQRNSPFREQFKLLSLLFVTGERRALVVVKLKHGIHF